MDFDDDDDHECPPEGAPAWMATFSDLATLLLTFFVLLLSFSNMDVVHFREMLGSVKDAFGVQHTSEGSMEAIASSPVQMSPTQTTFRLQISQGKESKIMRALSKYAKEQGIESKVKILRTKRGVVLRVEDTIFFPSGSATVKKESEHFLDKIREVAKMNDVQLAIEGHTDNIPISTSRFPSNWELSVARAISAMRHLTREGGLSENTVSVSGYGDTRPVAENKTAEGRAQNRRVEFVFIENEREESKEDNSASPIGTPAFRVPFLAAPP